MAGIFNKPNDDNRYAVNITNEKEWDEFFKILHRYPKINTNGLENFERYWDDYKETTAFNISEHVMRYGNVRWYNTDGYKVLSLKEFKKMINLKPKYSKHIAQLNFDESLNEAKRNVPVDKNGKELKVGDKVITIPDHFTKQYKGIIGGFYSASNDTSGVCFIDMDWENEGFAPHTCGGICKEVNGRWINNVNLIKISGHPKYSKRTTQLNFELKEAIIDRLNEGVEKGEEPNLELKQNLAIKIDNAMEYDYVVKTLVNYFDSSKISNIRNWRKSKYDDEKNYIEFIAEHRGLYDVERRSSLEKNTTIISFEEFKDFIKYGRIIKKPLPLYGHYLR